MKLTEKQKRFADYYIETGNGAEAARLAGYNGKNHDNIGTENLRKPAIKEYIEMNIKSKDEARIASQNEVLEYFTRVMRGESLAEVVVIEGAGEGRSEARRMNKAPDEKERIAAAKELAKRYGIDKPDDNNEMDGVKIEW